MAKLPLKEYKKKHWWARDSVRFSARALDMFAKLAELDSVEDKDAAFCYFPALRGASETRKGFLTACTTDDLLKFRGIGRGTIEEVLEELGYTRERIRCKYCGAVPSDNHLLDNKNTAVYAVKKKKGKR